MNKILIILRSTLFVVVFNAAVILYAIPCLLLFPFMPLRARFRVAIQVNRFVIWWFGLCCGVRYEIEGLENLPKDKAGVIVANHQSEWETFYLQVMVFPLCTVLKKELLKIPLFGWALAMIHPIAIDRSLRTGALKQIVDQGIEKIHDGFWVLIFPEGTRVKPGDKRKFSKTGAFLASEAQCPLVPVAHNAGVCWPPKGFRKYPGTLKLRIGQPINPQGKSVDELATESAEWIQQTREGF